MRKLWDRITGKTRRLEEREELLERLHAYYAELERDEMVTTPAGYNDLGEYFAEQIKKYHNRT